MNARGVAPVWRVLFALAAAVAALSPQPVAAEGTEYFVLPVTLKGERESSVQKLANDIEGELERRAIPVVDRQAAASRFNAAHADEAHSLPPSVVDDMNKASKDAALSFIQHHPAEAVHHVDRVRELAEQYLDSVNSNERTHQALLVACIAGVSAHVERQQSAQANALATWCLTTITNLNPDRDDLRGATGAFKAAQTELMTNSTRPLTIRSTPAGCTLLVQGAAVGVTPHVIEHPARRPYAIQARCRDGLVSRVYRVSPSERETLDIDVAFDQAVRSRQELWLRYDEGALGDQRIRDDADRISKLLHVGAAFAVYAPTPRQVTLRRIGARDGARIDLPTSYTSEQLRDAVDRALHGDAQVVAEDDEPPPATEAAPQADGGTDTSTSDAANPPHRRSAWPLWTGAALSLAGTAGYITGVALLRPRNQDGVKLRQSSDSPAAREQWDRAGVRARVTGGVGAAALSAGLIFLGDGLDPEERTWLPISSALLGATALTVGAVMVSGHRACPDNEYASEACIDREHQTDRGILVLSAAAPLLSFSTAQFVRWLLPPARLQASIGPGRLMWTATAQF